MKRNFKIIIGLLLLTIVIFVVRNINELNDQIVENQYNVLVNDLARVSTNFDIWITEKEAILNTSKDVVNNFSREDVFSEHTRNYFLNINNDDPDITNIYIGRKTGEFYTGGDWIPPDDYDPRTRVWYKEAVASNDTIISDVYIDRETGDTMVTISSPLYLEGSFEGVISTDVFLKDISDFIVLQIGTQDVYAYLLNSDGNIVIHTSRPNLIGQNIITDIKNQSVIDYFHMSQKTSEAVRMNYVYEQDEIRGIMHKIGGGEWYLAVASVNNDNIFSAGQLSVENAIFNFVVLMIIIVLLLQVIKVKQWLEQKNIKLKSDNERDFLTGIYNRKYFNLWMERLWSDEEECSIITLLMIDIDYFKIYNDTYGHLKGDEALQSVANVISSNIRKDDLFSRYGGEEFTIVLHDITAENAQHIANKIIDAVYDADILNENTPNQRITISIGSITIAMSQGLKVREVVNLADKALYQAKENGRNTLVAYNSDNVDLLEHREIL